MSSESKTRPTDINIIDFIAGLSPRQQPDAEMLVEVMRDISGEEPVLWGAKIVGFGTLRYKSKSGRESEWPRIGFAPGTGKFSLYLTSDAVQLTAQVAGLGTYKMGKGCVYINKLADVDLAKLRELVRIAYAADNPYS